MESVTDNVWAFLLFILASAAALLSSLRHDRDLMQFASTVAMTGAALFHAKNPEKKD